jgi:hypothetical protein
MTRREILRLAASAPLGILGGAGFAQINASFEAFKGQDVFDRIVKRAHAEGWPRLPIGELIGKIARELEGTPYVGFTLELSPDHEFCVINLAGLDCVTFFEDALGMARMLKRGGQSPSDLATEVTFTRYRGGILGDYTSRLHYTTDWFVDNEKKGVVRILTPELSGAIPFTQKVGIMTEHPENYRQLAAHPELVPKIREFESEINGRSLKFLPLDHIAAAEPLLQTGDIVGVCTTQEGIDIAHTGIVYKDADGRAHFMDASSKKTNMKVTLEPEFAGAFRWSHRLTGVMIARPLEPHL